MQHTLTQTGHIRTWRCARSVLVWQHALLRPSMAAPSLLGELWAFMRARKKLWLLPLVLVLLLVGMVIAFAQGSALAPFIYTIF